MLNVLIAYFSKDGENYVDGQIVNLKQGNTEVVAQKIWQLTRGDAYKIETVKSYPDDYYATTDVAKQEHETGETPDLKSPLPDVSKYDIIILGYPIWWDTFPAAVKSFLKSFDFTKKTILPFCTHEGSGLGRSERDLFDLCPKAEIKKGLSIYGHAVDNSDESIRKWLSSNGLA